MQRSEFHKRGNPILARTIFVSVAILFITILMNKDVVDRAYNYAVARPSAWIERPSILDRLCFRRNVCIGDSVFKVDLFGVNRILGRRPERSTTLISNAPLPTLDSIMDRKKLR